MRWVRVVSQNVTLPVDSAFPSAPQVRRGNDQDMKGNEERLLLVSCKRDSQAPLRGLNVQV